MFKKQVCALQRNGSPISIFIMCGWMAPSYKCTSKVRVLTAEAQVSVKTHIRPRRFVAIAQVALSDELTLEWIADFRTSSVEFLLTLQRTAWVAFGHSTFGSMIGGDV